MGASKNSGVSHQKQKKKCWVVADGREWQWEIMKDTQNDTIRMEKKLYMQEDGQ